MKIQIMQLSKTKSIITPNIFFQIGAFVLMVQLGSCDNAEEQNLPLKQTQSISLLIDKADIEKAELKEKLAYKNFHLTFLMEEVLRLNPDFNEISVKKLSKKGYSEAIYFDDLLSEQFIGEGQRSKIDSIQESLEAFNDLERESWHPYVLMIKEGEGNEYLFLINSYDPYTKKEIVQGYKLSPTGQLRLRYVDLSKEDIFGSNPIQETIGNTIYVLGILPENQENMLEVPLTEEEFEGGEGASSGGGSGSSDNYVKTQYVKIKDKKESWVEKADVKFEVVTATPSSLAPGDFRTHCGVNAGLGCYWNGSFLVHCNNSEVGDKRLINRNMGILQTGTFAEIAVYVIFEYDAWPAPTHVYEKTLNGESLKVGYRSYQSPYDEQVVNFNSQNPYNLTNGKNLSRNNSDIEYNFK